MARQHYQPCGEESSAAAHAGQRDASGLLHLASWFRKMDAVNWQSALVERQDPGMLRTLRVRTQTGRPLANDTFLSKLETKLGRRLRALPPGRPTGWRKKPQTAKAAKKQAR